MEGGSAYRRVLRNPALVRLLVGETVSSIGDWLYLVAILVVVYQVTADPVILGIVGAARLVPFVLLSVPAGIVADRYDRRTILLVTDLVRGALMIVLALLVSIDAPVIGLIAIAILAACFSAFFGPAIGAYLPTVVGDERDLGPANSLWATLDNLAYFIGPAIAGLLIAAGGLGIAFLLNALSFGFVALVLLTLPPGRPAADPPEDAPAPAEVATPAATPTAVHLADGHRATHRRRARRGRARRASPGMALSILLVLVAVDQLDAGPQAVGYLEAATGVGGVVAGIMAGWFVAKRLDVPLIVSGAVAAAGLVMLALDRQPGRGAGRGGRRHRSRADHGHRGHHRDPAAGAGRAPRPCDGCAPDERRDRGPARLARRAHPGVRGGRGDGARGHGRRAGRGRRDRSRHAPERWRRSMRARTSTRPASTSCDGPSWPVRRRPSWRSRPAR